MKCHQILTGAVNSGDNTYSVGSVEGINFTAYSSGCNIVILSPNFERVQIIPGVLNGNVQVNCIDASTDVGKIAACYGGPFKSNQLTVPSAYAASTNRICIFEPTPLIGKNSEHRLDYNWIKTAEIEPYSAVNVLSWNIEGTRLLTGGVEIQLWLLSPHCAAERYAAAAAPTTTAASPQVDEGLRMKPIKSSDTSKPQQQQQNDWTCAWSCKTSTPVAHLSFSPDGSLFCSTGRSDRLVKIWYQSATQSHLNSMFDTQNHLGSGSNLFPSASSNTSIGIGHSHSSSNLSFSFIYIAHPRAVTGISWRKISKYMPKGSLANMLVTSCRDNICRLWVQTLLPEDGLVNVSQLDGVSNMVTPRAQTQRHRQKLLQRLKHMKSFSHFKRRHHMENDGDQSEHLHHPHHHDDHEAHPIPNLPSTFSVHDFHGYGIHGTSVTPGGLHFHLTATINAENDIPLVPSLSQHLSESDLPSSLKQCPKVVINNSEPRVASPTVPANYSAQHLNHHHHHHHEESDKPLFVVQWLNNKEMAFTQNAEKIMHEIVGNIIESERQQKLQQEQHDAMSETSNNTNNEQSVAESVINRNKPLSRTSGGDLNDLPHPGHAASVASSSTNSLATMAVGSTTGTDGGGGGPAGEQSGRFENRKTVADYLDRKLESLMRDWHSNSDLLYSIHPLDGSLLVWLVEWLDEPSPSTFRQPQISFSSRIPNSIPLGDASTMSHNICLYSPSSFLDLKTVMSTLSNHTLSDLHHSHNADPASQQELQQFLPISLVHQSQQQQHQLQPLFGLSSNASPTLFMITKHNNGSLNLWKLVFGERTQFTQVLSISHSRRVCGHRFRVNDISCHSILPLLLTTSHHNIPGISASSRRDPHSPNTPDSTSLLVSPSSHEPQNTLGESSTLPNTGFCSELILWKVEPVGPLLKSGGVSELARINSLESTAFSNVAWIPTLLPSTALGSISNSPSACFVASDGRQLRIYQAVIDARSLLAEAQRYMINSSDRNIFYYDSSEEEDDEEDQTFKSTKPISDQTARKSDRDTFRSLFKIVSLQSTARPGCVLELSQIVDARHDWQNTQLLHVFQKQLIFGNQFEHSNSSKKSSKPATKPTANINKATPEISLPNGPIIDLGSHGLSVFEEIFYLVVVEKTGTGSTIHMWQIIISSRGKINLDDIGVNHQDQDEDSSRSVSPDNNNKSDTFNSGQAPPLRIRTRKVCTQTLPLPPDVEVIHAAPSAGHLSSSNIYPACYAAFLISTACSDNKIRFWRCEVQYSGKSEKDNEYNFTWLEWEMSLKSEPKQTTFDMSFQMDSLSSTLELPGSPLYVSCAYSGRIACAFKFGHSYMDLPPPPPQTQEEQAVKNEENRFINIGIVIYECQSSGGSEWILEDTIRIDRIPLLEMNSASMAKLSDIDIAPLVDTTLRNHQTSRKLTTRMSSNSLASTNPFATELYEPVDPAMDRVANIQRLLSVPSYTTIQSLRKIIAEQGNQFTFFQKSPVLLDWASTEDGFHILSCSAGHKIALFAPVSVTSTVPNASEMNKSTAAPSNNPVKANSLQAISIPQHSSTAGSASVSPSNFRLNLLDPLLNTASVTRWMMLRMTELDSVDGLPPLPMQMSWVRDGILVVGMDNEMVIFTQWKMSIPNSLPNVFENKQQNSKTKRPMATNFLFDSVDFPSERFFNVSKTNKDEMNPTKKPDPLGSDDQLISELPDDFGIFESFRLAFPVIPQYHPKQLMELLAFGKIHRVRAILSHLVTSLISINSIKEYLHHPANMQPQHGNSFESERSPRSWTRTRALSVSAQQHSSSSHELNSSPMDHSFGDPIVAEEIQLDYTEIASIRPLPLYALMQADEGISSDKLHDDKASKNDSGFALSLDINEPLDPDSLFDYNYKTQVEETLDEFLGNRTAFNFSNVATSKFLRNQQGQNQQPEMDNDLHISINFDQRQARLLTKLLTHSHLPGLTSLDQMHLLALADSLTSFDELADQRNSEDDSYANTSSISIDDQQLTVTANSLDDCGLRYLLNMRQHIYLLKCLPLYQRKALQKNGLGLHNIIWAYHSETQEELIQLIPSLTSTNNKVTWQELREYGVGFWIRNNSLLRKVIEKLAKSAFKTNNDPLDAALYYMAMKKKNLVWGLYRSVQDKKMTDFFSHDFTEDKWRKAALKNAYALMGKQRFEHAVSFFLLAGSLWDAVEICLNKLDDFQLAMVIIRLYGGGDLETVPDTLKKLLHDEILGYRQGVQDINYAHPNPFLRSMAYWTLHEYNQALDTLLEVNVGSKHCKIAAGLSMATNSTSNYTTPLPPGQENNFESLHPSVFNFYLYLRTQPLIVRRAQVAQQNIDSSAVSVGGNSALFANKNSYQHSKSKKSHMFSITTTNRSDAVAITPFERRLFFLTAYRHLRAGCPALALEVLSRLPTNILSYSEKSQIDECSRRMSIPEAATSGSGLLELESKSTSIQSIQSKAEDLFGSSSGGFDWGAPTSTLFQPVATDEFKITFDDEDNKVEDESEEEEDDGLLMKQVASTADNKPTTNGESANEEDHPVKIDVMAQQFKFISCLKIIMEELSTLATGFEVDGGQLRYQLYIWLERSVQTLKEICSYDTFSMRSFQDRGSFDGASGKNDNALMPSLSSFDRQHSSVLVATTNDIRKSSQQSTNSTTTTALHEILLADKEDFESKLERCRRRKAWLTANEALLRNLLSYCSLHGAQGGLASVRMELILLLQELQQDRSPQQQLLSPLPLPTTLPLLTSAVASQKTVVADPIRHLQSGIHDILETLVDINTYVHLPTNTAYSSLPDYLALPPFMISGTAANLTSWSAAQDHPPTHQSGSYISTLYTLIHILRQLGISLSSCIYQSLCDCDTVMHNSSISSTNPGFNRFKNGPKKKSSLTTSAFKTKSDSATLNPIPDSSSLSAVNPEESLAPTTSPHKWPGVQSLQALIVRDKDEDLPKLHTMLCEGFVAVYLSQLVYALTICDSSILYRLIGMDFTDKSWGELFGGGAKKLLYVSAASLLSGLGQIPGSATPADISNGSAAASNASPHVDLLNTLSKQRMKLHMKILEQLNQASAAAVAAGAAAAEAVSAVSSGMVNVATSPSGNQYNIGGQLSHNQQQPSSGHSDPRPTYREVFVPPQVSIINHLMRKPKLSDDLGNLDYDSMGSDDEGDEDEADSAFVEKFKTNDDEIDDDEYDEWANGGRKGSRTKIDRALEKRKANLEYELYAWCIIRLAATKIAHQNLNNFLSVSGLEKGDLPTTSPLIHSILKTLTRWQCAMQFYMNEYTYLPDHFLPNMFVDTDKTQGPAILKYKSLLESNNTPFRRGYTSIKASKRLWNYLVRQPSVQDLFIRYIFGKSRSLKLARDHGASAICSTEPGTAVHEQYDVDHKTMQPSNNNNEDGNNENTTATNADKDACSVMPGKRVPDPMRIVHKDQDIISAFCVNRSNTGLISLSTQKEIQEINIKPLLDSCVPWMEEDTELDILNLRQKHDPSYPLTSSYVDFLLVQHPTDRLQTSPGGQAIQRQISTASLASSQQQSQSSSTKTILIKRHKTETVRRLASHPTLPLYLSGGQDGSVNLWEWNHQQPISTARPPGTFAKVTRVQFNQQGNKFGVTDSDGNLSLWQVSATHNQPFFSLQCHNKTTSDFTFLGSSSLLMTAGHSTDHKNIVLWDTLMPVKKCMVSSFSCHEHSGAASIAYAPLNQILITGGRKGDVFIFDMRQRIQRERFQAHDSAVKCIALDPGEDFFATGSADGDIKVWSLVNSGRNLIFSFPGEHARSTFFRNIGMGVSHLYIDNCGRLFSCGADGSLKMRHLPTVECQPKYFFSPTSPSSQSLLFNSSGSGPPESEPPLISMRPPANVNNDYFNGNGIVNTY